jgi:DNA-binding response OmpR family regulator
MPELRSILLIEDDPCDVELIITSLTERNLADKVVVARDGEEAFDYLNCCGKFDGRNDGNPVVVLLDLKLPKINGLDVLKQMKNDDKLKCIPVVILTSSCEDRDIAEGYRLGANSFVVKPVDFHEFVDIIKLIGTYWALVSEPLPGIVRTPK